MSFVMWESTAATPRGRHEPKIAFCEIKIAKTATKPLFSFADSHTAHFLDYETFFEGVFKGILSVASGSKVRRYSKILL